MWLPIVGQLLLKNRLKVCIGILISFSMFASHSISTFIYTYEITINPTLDPYQTASGFSGRTILQHVVFPVLVWWYAYIHGSQFSSRSNCLTYVPIVIVISTSKGRYHGIESCHHLSGTI